MATFPQPEFASHILCNIHPWMRSYLFVFNNPYFAVTSADGAFDLKNVPPGTYTVEAWQEKYGTQDQNHHRRAEGIPANRCLSAFNRTPRGD